jgi:kelch-like protein 19
LRSAERFDPISSEWVTLPNMTSARRGLGTAAFKGHMLLAIGGWDGKMNLATVECLDVDKLFGWTLVAPLKVPRCSLSAVSSGDLVFVCGGWDGSDYLSSVECLSADGDGQEWRLLTRMNIPRSYCAAALCTSRFVSLFRSLARSLVLSLSLPSSLLAIVVNCQCVDLGSKLNLT